MRRFLFIFAALLFALGAVGYYGYEYVKQRPPDFLVDLVTKTRKPPPPLPAGDLAPLTTPDGFTATIFSREVPGARVMVRDPRGALLVSLTGSGKVVALRDVNADGVSDGTHTVLEGLSRPHGLAIVCSDTGNESADQDDCTLYVAETDAVKSYRYDADTYAAHYEKTLATLPSGGGHFTRTLMFEPNMERLFVSVGSSCNVCEEKDERRATVMAIHLATGTTSIYATGLRNTVFMATDPVFGEMWGTDNGRDLIGDDIPPDEVNIIREGKNYGWPICYGQGVHDTDFDKRQYFRDPCADPVSAHIDLQAHSAALGLAFIPEEGWPDGMGNDLLVAYHGSWNRSTPTGYKVVLFDLEQGSGREAKGPPIDFLTGFLAEGARPDDAIGRPVGLLAEPGGVVYVSDDKAGAIYKVAWNGEW